MATEAVLQHVQLLNDYLFSNATGSRKIILWKNAVERSENATIELGFL